MVHSLTSPIVLMRVYRSEQWIGHHWNRTSGIQCHHQQKLVDKMIPIYHSDSKRVSQIFISDKATKTHNASTLPFIRRDDASIDCTTDVPYIAILVDLGTEKSQFDAKWYSRRSNDGPSLRIHAAAINEHTFPFLEKCGIIEELRDLVSPPSTTFKSTTVLQNQVQFGSTSQDCHTCWQLKGHHEKSGLTQQEEKDGDEKDGDEKKRKWESTEPTID